MVANQDRGLAGTDTRGPPPRHALVRIKPQPHVAADARIRRGEVEVPRLAPQLLVGRRMSPLVGGSDHAALPPCSASASSHEAPSLIIRREFMSSRCRPKVNPPTNFPGPPPD